MRVRARVWAAVVAAGAAVVMPGATAWAQGVANPVYVDDSPVASETFARVRDHLASGNGDEAVRVLQILLDEQAERLVASETDRAVFVSVRAGVQGLLLSTPALLERYRVVVGPRAQLALEEGRRAVVERAMLLTRAGLDAAVSIARQEIEEARFEAARLTLEQLERHPDRKGEAGAGAAEAAEAAALLARYLNRPEVREMAVRWAKEAGRGAPVIEPVQWPAAALDRGQSPLEALPPLNVQGMISKPLWTAPLGPAAAPLDPNAPVPGVRGPGGQLPALARDLLILPTVLDDTVFVTDGATISAWDRFTLSPRWSVSPGVADAPQVEPGVRGNRLRLERLGYGWSQRNDDLCALTADARTVVGATGRGGSSGRDGDDRLHALDAATGRVRWTVQIGALDPLLADSTVRGPAAIIEGVVVVAARKYLPERRLVSLTLAGLDLATGKLLWVRPIGSAGSLPFVVQSSGSELFLVDRGVVYRVDRLGVVSAVEAGTGRVRWVRRMPVEGNGGADQSQPWHIGGPVVDGETILTLAPDGRRVLRLDMATGAIKGERPVSDFAPISARYLVRVGDRLAVVADDRVALVRAATMETDVPQRTLPLTAPGIRGRVSVTGDRLLVPTVSGFMMVDPAEPGHEPTAVNLEEPGNVLALDRQLVVVDDQRVHSYLLWEVAEALLTERMTADPADPAPAITFAELAYRAGRQDRIAGAVEAAAAALAKAPPGEATQAARARLMEALGQMTLGALEPGAATPARGQTAPRALTDPALIRALVARMGELATTADERVAFVLASGRVEELSQAPERAVETYQKVLGDPALSGATWRGPQISVRGELEAVRRIETLIKQHGPAIYAAQERLATAELAGLGVDPTVQQMESLVARFPLASVTPGVWARLSAMYRAAGQTQQAVAALESGLRAAQRSPSAPPAAVGELAGQLILDLRSRQQLAAAAGVLRQVRGRFPGATLTADGRPIDADQLGAELAERIAESMRWARVGPVRPENVQAIAGWTIMEPLLRDRSPAVTPMLALQSDDEASVWTVPTAGQTDKKEAVTKVWSRPLGEGGSAHLIRNGTDAAYFLLLREGDGHVEKVGGGAVAGGAGAVQSKWKSEGLLKAFSRDDSRGMRRVPGVIADRFTLPDQMSTAVPSDLIVVMDDRTIVVMQRGGRAVGIDTDTGETLWTLRSAIGRVYDADISSGLLAIAGDQEVSGPGGVVVDLKPAVQVVDARTGRPVQRLSEGALGGSGHTRWVKLADSGALVIGLDTAVVCVDPVSGQINWTITSADIMPAVTAWVFGDTLVMLSGDRVMWLASIATGRLRPGPLDLPRTHVDATRQIEAFALSAVPGTGFGVSTHQGIVLFDSEGELAGIDGLGGAASMTPPRPAEGRALTIETVAEGRTNEGLMMFSLHAMDLNAGSGGTMIDSRPVLLGARPTGMSLIDGHVAITAGNVTVILQAPAPGPKKP